MESKPSTKRLALVTLLVLVLVILVVVIMVVVIAMPPAAMSPHCHGHATFELFKGDCAVFVGIKMHDHAGTLADRNDAWSLPAPRIPRALASLNTGPVWFLSGAFIVITGAMTRCMLLYIASVTLTA